MLRCLRLYQLPALSVLLFPVRAAPVRWSVPYPVPFGFLQNARLWYQSASRLCCGLFRESLSVLQVLFRCSTRRYTQKNSPTYQARNVGRQHRRRFSACTSRVRRSGRSGMARAVSCSVAWAISWIAVLIFCNSSIPSLMMIRFSS